MRFRTSYLFCSGIGTLFAICFYISADPHVSAGGTAAEDPIAKLKARVDELESQNHSRADESSTLSLWNPPIGTVIAYAGVWPPKKPDGTSTTEAAIGWKLCNGDKVDAAQYPELAAAIGDGTSQVTLPHLAGRVILGSGQGKEGEVALTDRKLNDHGGEELHTLTVAEMPQHSHGVSDPGHVHDGLPTDEGVIGDGGSERSITSWFKGSQNTKRATTGITLQNAGEGKPHNSMPPFLTLHYIIKVAAIR